MDKNYLAKRLIYFIGRSDPNRINSVFERVLHELDNYINENIPYKFSLKKDIAIRNWIAQSDKETVQLIKLWILFKEESNINIFKNQKEILNFLPNSNKVFWLYECLLKNRIPTIKQILKELSAYPELIAILILVYHKQSYKRLRDLIGEITDTFSKVPKKGASALKLFLRHSVKASFSQKEFLSLNPDLAGAILHLYSPLNNRYEVEINSTFKLIGREILKKYGSNRKYWDFTPEKKNELVLLDKSAHSFERRRYSSKEIQNIIDSREFSSFLEKYKKLLHGTAERKERKEWSNNMYSRRWYTWFYPEYIPSYINVKKTILNSRDQNVIDNLVPIVLEKKDIFKHLNNISWNRAKLILSTMIDLILENYPLFENPIGPNKDNVISYYKYCSPKRKVQFFRWVYENKLEYYKRFIINLLVDLNKIDAKIFYENKKYSTLIDLNLHDEKIKTYVNNNKQFIFYILDIDHQNVVKTLPYVNVKIIEKYLKELKITPSSISKYIYLDEHFELNIKYDFLNKQDRSIKYLINLLNKERFYISEDNYFLIIDKIIEENLKIPKNLIYNTDNSLHSTLKKCFYELIKRRINLGYFQKHNYFGTKFINQLYLDSPRKFWKEILKNTKVNKKSKNDIFENITAKSFINSLISDSGIAKYFNEPSTVKNYKNYLNRNDVLKDRPGIKAAYELSFETNVRILPLILNILKKSEYSHLKRFSGSQFDGLYHTYKLPKKTGGNRIITVPHKYLKYIQKITYESILKNLPLHNSATGFRKGYSIVDNAKIHVGNKIVVNIDIANFFPKTSKDLVWQVINTNLKNRFSKNCIRLISELCCYKGGLPMGAPTSPAISNLVLKPCDVAISKVSKKLNIAYTRYADDLTFSGNGASIKILPFVKEVLEQKGYKLDSKKTNIFRKGRRQSVTGLVVNKQISIARPIRKRIRASVHNACQKKPIFWYNKPMSINELMGRIAFLKQVHPKEAEIYKNQLQKNKLL